MTTRKRTNLIANKIECMNKLIINFQQNKGCFADKLYTLRQFTLFAVLTSSAKNKYHISM